MQSQVSEQIEDIKKNMNHCQTSLDFNMNMTKARARSNYSAILLLNAENPMTPSEIG